jgi:hypothetical protein
MLGTMLALANRGIDVLRLDAAPFLWKWMGTDCQHQPEAHLADFYAGLFPGSFARGALFQDNPVTGDARTSGMAASLCGIEAALEAGDPGEITAALRRLESMYAVAFSFGGLPLIYMGDEPRSLPAPPRALGRELNSSA